MGVHVIDDDDAARDFLMFLFKAATFLLRVLRLCRGIFSIFSLELKLGVLAPI